MLTTLWIGKADEDSQILTFQSANHIKKSAIEASIKIPIIHQNNATFSRQ